MARDADRQARLAQQRASAQLAEKLAGIATAAKANRSTGFRIPELDADPAADDPTNVWVLADGRFRIRTLDGIVHEFKDVASTGGTTGGTTSTKPKPADPVPKKYRKSYAATWGRAFCPQHGAESGGSLNYGNYSGSSAHGFRRIMLGFDDAAIRADLAGATIRSVELSVRNDHAFLNSGVDIVWGAHNRATVPGSYSAVRRGVYRGHWPKVGYGPTWRTVPDWYGAALRDNAIKGLTVDQPSSSDAYYGALDWSSARLRVTYTK